MMKSVYAKVLSWSIGVLILSLVVFLFVSRARAMVYNAFGNDGELRILIATQFAEGDRIYQAEGDYRRKPVSIGADGQFLAEHF